jgi:hypothetical protein
MFYTSPFIYCKWVRERGILYRIVHFEDFFFWGWGLGLKTALYGGRDGLAIFHCHVSISTGRIAEPRGNKNAPDSFIKHTLQVPLSQGGTFQVLVCSNLLCDNQGLIVGDWLHTLLSQALEGSGILSEIELRADEDDGNRGRMVVNLGEPL